MIEMGYLICEECGGYYELQEGESPEDFDSCSCGGKLKYVEFLEAEMIFCPNCGNKTPAKSIFCGNCGYKLKHHIQTDKPPIESDNFDQWNYENNRTAITLGWIPFFYSFPVLFNPLIELLIGAYLTTRNNIRAKWNGKTIIYLSLGLICEIIVLVLIFFLLNNI